ncbi:MAG TPA: serine hydrolase [Burkholderiales bacterium]|nr:serine hydrolase [Burkholderiales bacterium]
MHQRKLSLPCFSSCAFVAGSQLTIAAAIAAVLAGPAQADPVPDRYPDLAAAYLVQVDGRDLWAGHPDARLPPASLTKIMTALVVLEDYRPDEVVTIGPAAAAATGTRLHVRAGDRLKVSSLLSAMLMVSANDACAALATHVAGTAEAFVARMNERAAQLGLANTRFENPCGFDAAGHYASARDLATLANAAMRRAEFAAIVARETGKVTSADGRRTWTLKNRNALVGTYAPAIGIKTGYTGRAGKCLVALAEKDGARVLVVMLAAKSRWWDTIGLIERAFDAAHAAR